MNKLMYFAPLALLPLMALSQRDADGPVYPENPYATAAMVLIVALGISMALVGYFNLQNRGRRITGAVCAISVWIITAPLAIFDGMAPLAGIITATISALLSMFLVVRYGLTVAAYFNGRDTAEYDTDKE
jgi:hypothetical protein